MTLNSTRSALASQLQDYLDSLVSNQFVSAQSFAESIAMALAEAEAESKAVFIVFFYDLDNIRDQVYMLSHYKAKNIRSQEKEPKERLDELTITADEEEMLDKLLKDAAKDVYKLVAPYGRDIAGGYLFNPVVTLPVEYDDEALYNEGDLFYVDDQLYYTLADDTPAGTDPENTDYFAPVGEWYNTYHKVVYTLNYNSNMDASMIDVLNEDLEDLLIKHCLLGWYRVIQEVPMIQLSEMEYEDAKIKALRSLWAEKTLTRRRTELF